MKGGQGRATRLEAPPYLSKDAGGGVKRHTRGDAVAAEQRSPQLLLRLLSGRARLTSTTSDSCSRRRRPGGELQELRRNAQCKDGVCDRRACEARKDELRHCVAVSPEHAGERSRGERARAAEEGRDDAEDA